MNDNPCNEDKSCPGTFLGTRYEFNLKYSKGKSHISQSHKKCVIDGAMQKPQQVINAGSLKTFVKIRGTRKEKWEMLGFIVPVLVTWGHNLAFSEFTKLIRNRGSQHLCPSLVSKASQVSKALQDISPNILLGWML